MVVWIIGLSGSGKTTLADHLINELLLVDQHFVKIDGDIIREIFDNDLGHTYNDRRKNARRISRLCKFLEGENQNIICSILSISEEDRIWNRKNYKNYIEIYISVENDEIIKRDTKGLYKAYQNGEIKNVVGCDIKFEIPKKPDYIINNNKGLDYFFSHTDSLIKLICNE